MNPKNTSNYSLKVDFLSIDQSYEDVTALLKMDPSRTAFSRNIVMITPHKPDFKNSDSLFTEDTVVLYDVSVANRPVSSEDFGRVYQSSVPGQELDSVVKSAANYFRSKIIVTSSDKNRFDVVIPRQTLKNLVLDFK